MVGIGVPVTSNHVRLERKGKVVWKENFRIEDPFPYILLYVYSNFKSFSASNSYVIVV